MRRILSSLALCVGTVSAIASPADDYELRGFFGLGSNVEVSIRRVGSGKSEWLRVGQKSGDLLIEKADAKSGTATLVTGGRRVALRLAGERPSEVEEAKLSPEEARSARKARLGAMMRSMTNEQLEAMFQVIEAPALIKAHPELKGYFTGHWPQDAEERKKMAALVVPLFHEAMGAAMALPGKDGKITPLPADFDAIVTEHILTKKIGANLDTPDDDADAESEKDAETGAKK